jgi:membrane protein insertase Oxa1/YidC/SpoIIIJ
MMKYMSDKQLLPPDKLRELKTQIDAVNKTYQDSAQAKSAIQALIRKAGLYSGLGVGGAAGYYGYKSLSD